MITSAEIRSAEMSDLLLLWKLGKTLVTKSTGGSAVILETWLDLKEKSKHVRGT